MMAQPADYAIPALYLCWSLYFLAFLVCHLRVRGRRQQSQPPEERVLQARVSDLGLFLEFLGITVAFAFRRQAAAPTGLAMASVTIGICSVLLTWYALAHLGRQWRIRAVVTVDHELITTGPYRVVRHPVYASLLGMLLATVLLLTRWPAALIAVAFYLAGTEIRVRAEDALLARHFPVEFPAYRSRVCAYIPLLR